MATLKVVHYINQFFAQIGGEEKADYPAELRAGEIIGPGSAFQAAFGDEAEIIATIVCGDSYFNENIDKAKADILEMVKSQEPDLFIAGPAFNAGRYGVACGTITDAVLNELGIPALTGMYVENPEGTFSGFSQAIDVSILAGEEKTILFTHELAMGDMYWIFISDDRKDQENESSWNYGYCEEYGYTVSPGVVYWKGTGERYAVAPTDEITVSEDVAAVSFEDIDNFTGVTITPNSNDNE